MLRLGGIVKHRRKNRIGPTRGTRCHEGNLCFGRFLAIPEGRGNMRGRGPPPGNRQTSPKSPKSQTWTNVKGKMLRRWGGSGFSAISGDSLRAWQKAGVRPALRESPNRPNLVERAPASVEAVQVPVEIAQSWSNRARFGDSSLQHPLASRSEERFCCCFPCGPNKLEPGMHLYLGARSPASPKSYQL